MSAAPAVLMPYQQRWLKDPARVKVFEKARRIGASWATAGDCVLEAGSGKLDIWYISYSEDSGKDFILDCVKWGRWLRVPCEYMGFVLLDGDQGDERGVYAHQIRFPNGKRITAMTSVSRNLRGKQGRVVIDEAAFHDDLRGILKAAFAHLMWGGEVWILSTHNGIDNEFSVLVNEIRDQKRSYSLHRVTIEDALAEGLYVRICEVLQQPWSYERERAWLRELEAEYGDGVREELYCEPAQGGAAYLGRPLIEAAMIDAPVVRIKRDDAWALRDPVARQAELHDWCEAVLAPLCAQLPGECSHAFGWDFGRYIDLSVLAPITLQQNLVRRVPFLLEMQNLPHNDQWLILRYVCDRLPRLFRGCMDAGGNGAWIAEQAWTRYGDQTIERLQLSVQWYAQNMPAFREAHERSTIRYPRDLDVRNDLLLIRRIDGVPRIASERALSKATGGKRHGDAAIALCLGYAASSVAMLEHERWDALSSPY
jgi:phage FluMu gp28-like protein